VRIVRDHMGIDLLLKLSSARCLAPFIRTEHTLGTAAKELEMPASSLAYHVGRFRKAGLVDVVRLEPRAGKPIPVYRATADQFEVPFHAMPPGRRDEFLHGSRRHVLAEFVAAMDHAALAQRSNGIRVSSHPVRGMQIEFAPDDRPDDSPITEWWGKVRLSEEEAIELRDTLEALAARFGGDEPGPGRLTYLAMFGLVPARRR
jgi:DNA-binding transcriptional ArsR family regulator